MMSISTKSNTPLVAHLAPVALMLVLWGCGGDPDDDTNNATNNDINNATNNDDDNNATNNTNNTNGSNNVSTNNATNNATNNDTSNNATNNTSGSNNATNNTNNPPPAPALVQILNLSHDATAPTVDVFQGGELLLDDLAYATGTDFFPVPVDTAFPLEIKPNDGGVGLGGSFTVDLPADILTEGSSTIVVVTGSLARDDAGTPREFGVEVITDVTTVSDDADLLDLIVYHGASDAPLVDVALDNDRANLVADALDYKEYVEVQIDPSAFTFGTTGLIDVFLDEDDTFFAGVQTPDLSGLAGRGAFVAAIGSVANGDFEVVAFPAGISSDGMPTVHAGISLDASARLQLIHNSADAAVATIDVYADPGGLGARLVDDFGFRDGTPYLSMPSRIDLALDVVAGGDADNSSPIADGLSLTLAPGSTTVAIATGVVGGSGNQAFELVTADGKETIETMFSDQSFALIGNGVPGTPTIGFTADRAVVTDVQLTYPQLTDTYVMFFSFPTEIDVIVDGRPFLRTTQDVPFDLFGKTPVVMLMSGPPAGVLLENYGLLVVTPNGAVGTDQLFYPLAPPRF